MKVPNMLVLNSALHAIHSEPWRWDQGTWISTNPEDKTPVGERCGTTMCLAGHIAYQDENTVLKWMPTGESDYQYEYDYLAGEYKQYWSLRKVPTLVDKRTGKPIDIAEFATEKANLRPRLAHELFYASTEFDSPQEFSNFVRASVLQDLENQQWDEKYEVED